MYNGGLYYDSDEDKRPSLKDVSRFSNRSHSKKSRKSGKSRNSRKSSRKSHSRKKSTMRENGRYNDHLHYHHHSPPLDLNGEVTGIGEDNDKYVVCYYCGKTLLVKKDWKTVECSDCHKKNYVTKQNYPPDIHLARRYEEEDYVICPVCKEENKFILNSSHVICYNCGNMFRVNPPEYEDPLLLRPPQESVQFRYYLPMPQPEVECKCNNEKSASILKEILDELDEKPQTPKNTYMPYPTIDPLLLYRRNIRRYYDYDRDIGPRKYFNPSIVTYLPTNTEPNINRPENDCYRITIRKKPKVSQSETQIQSYKGDAFEKVFFTKNL